MPRRVWIAFVKSFVFIMLALVIALGMWGDYICHQQSAASGQFNGWDSFYRSIQLLGLNFEYQHCEENIGGELKFARFLAVILLFFAVVRLLFSRVSTLIKLKTQAIFFAENRHILVGYGALNQEIARERASWGKPLTIVARAFDGAAADFAQQNRAVLIERDMRDKDAFAGLLPHRARRIIVACGDDSLTMEIARQISRTLAERRTKLTAARIKRLDKMRERLPNVLHFMLPRTLPLEDIVYAHFTSTEMHRQMLLTRELGLRIERRYSGFAIREETARYLFSRAWFVERAKLEGQDRVHIVVVGAGDLGLAITREALQHGCSVGLEPPLVTVVDRNCAKIRDQFEAAMPHIFHHGTIPREDRPKIRFVTCEAEAVACKNAEGDVPVTGWILACTSDATNLTLAMQLEAEMRHGRRAPAPIYPRQWQGNLRDGTLRRIGQDDPMHLVSPFGGMQDVVPTLSFLDDQWLNVAKSIHSVYQSTVQALDSKEAYRLQVRQHGAPPWDEGQGPSDPEERAAIEAYFSQRRQRYRADWGSLPNEARLANMASAQQAAVRLWEMGFDWKGRHRGILPHIDKVYVGRMLNDAALADLSPDTRLGSVAKAEHRRWMVERALRGWSALKAKGRSNPLRLHFDFRSYEDLLAEAVSIKTRQRNEGSDEPNPQLLDAASVRGIMIALSEVSSTGRARPTTQTLHSDLIDVAEIPSTTSHLELMVRPFDPDAGESDFARLDASILRIAEWCKFETSFSIRMTPETEGVWAEEALKRALSRLVIAARESDVHITIEMLDGRSKRDALIRRRSP